MSSSDNNRELPPWLRKIPLPPAPRRAERDAPAPPEPPAAPLPHWLAGKEPPQETQEESPLPAWLQDESAGEHQGEEGSVPSWLRDAQATAEPTDRSSPSWLMDVGQRDSSGEADEVAPEVMPDWLRELGAESAAAEGSSVVPPRSAPAEPEAPVVTPAELSLPEPEPPPAPPADETAGLDVEPFTWEGIEAPSKPPAAPSWLGESGESNEDVAPAWLSDITRESPQPPVAPEAPVEIPPAEATTAPPGEADWLRSIGMAESPEATSQPSEPALEPPAPASERPAWLESSPRDESQSAAEAPPWPQATPEQPQAEELPAWLQATPEQPQAEELPAWLREERPAPAEPAEEMPEWLRERTPAEGGTPPSGSALPEDLPDWLKPTGATDQPAVVPPGEVRDDVPDWLKTAAPAQVPEQRERPVAGTPGAEDETLPEWLRSTDTGQDDVPPWMRDESGAPLAAAAEPEAGLPEWLRGASSEPMPRLEQPELAHEPSVEAEIPQEPEQTPPEIQPGIPESPVVPAEPVTESAFLGETDLPAWLRQTEPETPSELRAADARSLDWLTRLGPREEEAAALGAATAVARLTPRPTPPRTQHQTDAIALLSQLAAEPFPDAAPAVAPPRPSFWRRIGIERVLYFVLLIVMIAALAAPALAAPLQVPPTSPNAAALFQQIDSLGERDVVLVGYEWDARRVSELRPLEQAVIGHLLARNVKLVLVSTDPQGSLLAYQLRDQLAQAGYREGGVDYVYLGYKPGGEIALRSLVQNFRGALASDFQGEDATRGALVSGLETGRPLQSLSDLAMIVVLADDAPKVQGWMEQVYRGGFGGQASSPPIALLMPAETGPIAQPYTQLPRVYNLAGKQGALAYQALGDPGDASTQQVAQESSQLRLGLLVFVALAVIGGVLVGIAALIGRGRAQR